MSEGMRQDGKAPSRVPGGSTSLPGLASGGERRRYPRQEAERLLAYTRFGENQAALDMGMAKTVDLSEGGVGILIHRAVGHGETLHLFMAVEENLVESKARVVHQRPLAGGYYQIGACFLSMEERGRRYSCGKNSAT